MITNGALRSVKLQVNVGDEADLFIVQKADDRGYLRCSDIQLRGNLFSVGHAGGFIMRRHRRDCACPGEFVHNQSSSEVDDAVV